MMVESKIKKVRGYMQGAFAFLSLHAITWLSIALVAALKR